MSTPFRATRLTRLEPSARAAGPRPIDSPEREPVPRRASVGPGRLPRPQHRPRPRKEIRLRPATAADAAACAALDGTYATSHIWQLDTRQEGDELRVCFRLVRLPRELTLVAEHRPPALPRGVPRRDLLWLVAEEVEVIDTDGPRSDWSGRSSGPGTSAERSTSPDAPAAPSSERGRWSHVVRPSKGVSTVQLGLPDEVPATRQPASRPAARPPLGRIGADESGAAGGRGTIVGYIVAGAASGDERAYVRTLAVDRAHRRKGIAARLLVEAQRWAARQGAEQLLADVPARNYPAIHLLQKAGFTFCGYNDRCYPDQEVALFFAARLR